MSNISTNSAATKPTDDNLPIGAKALAALRAECRRKVEKAMNAKEESFEVWAHHYCVATLQSRLVDCLSTKAPRLLAREAAHAAPPIKTLTCLRKRIAGWAEQERRAAAKAGYKNSFAKRKKPATGKPVAAEKQADKPDPVGDKIAKDIEAGRERLRKRAKTAAAKPPAADGAVGNFAVKLHGSAAKKARAVAAAMRRATPADKKTPPAPPKKPRDIADKEIRKITNSQKGKEWHARPCIKDPSWQCFCPPFSPCLKGTKKETIGDKIECSADELKIRKMIAAGLTPEKKGKMTTPKKAAKPAKKGRKMLIPIDIGNGKTGDYIIAVDTESAGVMYVHEIRGRDDEVPAFYDLGDEPEKAVKFETSAMAEVVAGDYNIEACASRARVLKLEADK